MKIIWDDLKPRDIIFQIDGSAPYYIKRKYASHNEDGFAFHCWPHDAFLDYAYKTGCYSTKKECVLHIIRDREKRVEADIKRLSNHQRLLQEAIDFHNATGNGNKIPLG